MSELTSLRNIGSEMDKKLKAVDIATAEELIELGAERFFSDLKCVFQIYAAFIFIRSKEQS